MQYLKPTFSLPAAPSKVTQERWDEIFGSVENKEVSDPQIAPGFDMRDPKAFAIYKRIALSQTPGWASDGLMAGGRRRSI